MSDSVKKWHEMQEQTHKAYPGDIRITENSYPNYEKVHRTAMIYESPDGGKTIRERPIRDMPTQDKHVQHIKNKFEQRSQTGIKKYGTTLERDDLDIQDWLTHFEEELMDGLLYLQVIKDKLK